MKRKTKGYLIFLAILVTIISWILILNFVSISEIIIKIGATNSYIILFIIAAAGGVSSLTASSYFLVVSVLAIGGLNPAFIGLVGGMGVTIGDSLFFYLGLKGKEISPKDVNKKLEKLEKILKKSPRWLVPFLVYIYSGFVPLPNDIMTISLGISGYSFKRVILPLLLGNITATMIVSYISIYGTNLFWF